MSPVEFSMASIPHATNRSSAPFCFHEDYDDSGTDFVRHDTRLGAMQALAMKNTKTNSNRDNIGTSCQSEELNATNGADWSLGGSSDGNYVDGIMAITDQ